MEYYYVNKKQKKCLFSKEEDQLLIQLYYQYPNQWNLISKFIPNRNSRQCHDRFKTYLDPNISLKEWSENEDNLILLKVNEIGTKWVKISYFFEGRTDTAIKNRYQFLLRKLKNQKESVTNLNEIQDIVSWNSTFNINSEKIFPEIEDNFIFDLY